MQQVEGKCYQESENSFFKLSLVGKVQAINPLNLNFGWNNPDYFK